MSKIFSSIAVFALLAFAGWLAWLFFDNIRVADANIKAGLIGLLGMLAAALITHYQTKKREINARHFADKRAGYMHMIDLLFDFMLAEKSGGELSGQGTLEKMMLFKKAMLVWGSPEIIETWNQYELDYAKGMTPERIVGRMESILRIMRKDLGHDDSALKAGHLWELILKAEDKKSFLRLLNDFLDMFLSSLKPASHNNKCSLFAKLLKSCILMKKTQYKENTMRRLSIEISQEQHQRLKAVAALAGKSIKDYVLERALPPLPNSDSLSEGEALQKLEEFLKLRIEAAERGKTSSRSAQQIFEDVRRIPGVVV